MTNNQKLATHVQNRSEAWAGYEQKLQQIAIDHPETYRRLLGSMTGFTFDELSPETIEAFTDEDLEVLREAGLLKEDSDLSSTRSEVIQQVIASLISDES